MFSCTIKIGLNGDVLFCDDLLTNILNLPTSDVERIIGKKIWEVLFERRHESEMELKGYFETLTWLLRANLYLTTNPL